MTEYDEDKLKPSKNVGKTIEPVVGVCVGGPSNGAMLTLYPASVYPGQIIVSKFGSQGEYTYQPETEEYSAAFMWRDYE